MLIPEENHAAFPGPLTCIQQAETVLRALAMSYLQMWWHYVTVVTVIHGRLNASQKQWQSCISKIRCNLTNRWDCEVQNNVIRKNVIIKQFCWHPKLKLWKNEAFKQLQHAFATWKHRGKAWTPSMNNLIMETNAISEALLLPTACTNTHSIDATVEDQMWISDAIILFRRQKRVIEASVGTFLAAPIPSNAVCKGTQ